MAAGLMPGLRPVPAAELPVTTWQGRTMGSDYTVKLAGTSLPPAELEAVKHAVDRRLQEVNRQMSHYQPDSELSRFNRAPANEPFKISPGFAQVVRFSLDLARRSEGAFDPTLSPVINLWGFGERTNRPAVPTEADLASALKRVGWRHLRITPQNELVKDLPELSLNLSAVAKGFGVDEMGRVLGGHGLTNFQVAIAGEVLVRGNSPRGAHWHIGVAAPVDQWREHDPFLALATLSDQAISTSGDYQKFFRDDRGRRFCHLLDPRTGWPVQHDLAGVSVVAPDGMTADALGTTLFVLGPAAGVRFIEEWTNAAALFLVRDSTGGFQQVRSRGFPILPP